MWDIAKSTEFKLHNKYQKLGSRNYDFIFQERLKTFYDHESLFRFLNNHF